VAALIPIHDPRAIGFQRRSFQTELFDAVQRTARSRFEDLRCRPTWLNAMDFQTLAKASRIRAVPRALEDFEGSTQFLKFMGAREATLPELAPGLDSNALTSVGAAEVVAHLAKLHATKQIDTAAIDAGWRLWTVDDTPVSLEEARQAQKPLDQSFLDMVSERIGMSSELRRMVASLVDAPNASRMVPELPAAESGRSRSHAGELQNSGSSAQALPRRTSLRRWRSAEQQVLSLLELQGWDAEDVSRQNVGYDIEVRTPEGEQFFVEVKSIRNPSEPFILTSNEEAVARIKGDAYQLALVRDAGAELEVAFI
jgi:hypothetical protein